MLQWIGYVTNINIANISVFISNNDINKISVKKLHEMFKSHEVFLYLFEVIPQPLYNKRKEVKYYMNFDNVRLSLVRYKVDKLELIIPTLSSPYEVFKDLISNILIDFNYEEYYHPFFEIDIVITNRIYREMKKNPLKIKANVKIQKGYFKNTLLSPDDKAVFSDYINDTYYVFMEDMSPDITESRDIQIEKTGNDYGAMTQVKLLLYNQDYYFGDGIVNTVLTSATLVDALAYVINKAGYKKVLLSPPDNYKTYSEFILTPIPYVQQLERICNEYGMHKTGTLIFFDLKCLYIIDKSKKCTAYQNNEYKVTYLVSTPSKVESMIKSPGCYRNNEDKYNLINIDGTSIQCKALTEINEKVYGNSYTTIDHKSGTVKTTLFESKNVTKVYVVNSGDDTSSALQNSLFDETRLLTCGFSSVDLDMLTPNKQFILSIDDSKLSQYNGKYRLVRTVASFNKEGDYFNPVITCSFKG